MSRMNKIQHLETNAELKFHFDNIRIDVLVTAVFGGLPLW